MHRWQSLKTSWEKIQMIVFLADSVGGIGKDLYGFFGYQVLRNQNRNISVLCFVPKN